MVTFMGAIGQSLYGGIKSYGFRVVWHALEPNHMLPLLHRARNCTLHCSVLVGSRNWFEHNLYEQNCLFYNGTKI